MSDELVANFTLNNTSLNAQYELSEGEQIDATFKIYANATEWGKITGDISEQEDLIEQLNAKADIDDLSQMILDRANTMIDLTQEE